MIIASNNAEGGVNGAVPTSSDTGSGTSWSDMVVDTDKIKYSNAHAAHGNLSYEFSQGTSTGIRLRWNATVTGNATNIYGRICAYTTGTPAASNKLVWAINSASSLAWGVNYGSTSTIVIKNSTDTTVWSSTNRVPLNQWFRVEWHIISGSSGTMQIRLFNGLDYTTPIEDSGLVTGNYSTETAMVAFGPGNMSPAMPLCYMDDIAIADSTHGWIGPAGSPVANPQVGWGAGKTR